MPVEAIPDSTWASAICQTHSGDHTNSTEPKQQGINPDGRNCRKYSLRDHQRTTEYQQDQA